MQRYALRDDQWTKIKDFLPGREGHVGGTAADNRLFVDALLYRYRTGIPWRDLPERYGAWKPTHKRYRRWCGKRSVRAHFSRLWRWRPTRSTCRSIQPASAPTNIAPAPKKTRRGPSHRTIPWRLDDQNPRHCRCARQPRGAIAHSRSGRRYHAGRTLARIRSRPMRSLPTKAMTATHWSRRFKNAASPQSFLRRQTAMSRARLTSPYIASAISSNASSANSSNTGLSQPITTNSLTHFLPPSPWFA